MTLASPPTRGVYGAFVGVELAVGVGVRDVEGVGVAVGFGLADGVGAADGFGVVGCAAGDFAVGDDVMMGAAVADELSSAG
jgi:hypothetical protein